MQLAKQSRSLDIKDAADLPLLLVQDSWAPGTGGQMNLQKAIEVLGDKGTPPELRWDTEFCEAKQLGIKALKLVIKLQGMPGRQVSFRLPGETED